MNVRCPNEGCNAKMHIHDKVVASPIANVRCVACKKSFKPYDTLTEEQKIIIAKKNKTANSSSSPTYGRKETLGSSAKKTGEKLAIGWLIVHDENTKAQTYELKEGVQVAGKNSSTRPCDIEIETDDRYFSRRHFSLEVKKSHSGFIYSIKDAGSTNGTYVESARLGEFNLKMRKLAPREEVYLVDGSVIQAGRTKIVLKTGKTVSSKEEATILVGNQQITKTVIV